MAPVEPKRRVKSIKKPGDNPMAKVKKPKTEKTFSRSYIHKLLSKVLRRRANMNDSVQNIYKTYRRMIKMACEYVARRHRKVTMKEAQVAMDRLIPKDVAMNAIREFRQQMTTPRSRRYSAPSSVGATSNFHG